MFRKIYPNLLAILLLSSTSAAFADLAACPTAAVAQSIVNSVAANLKPMSGAPTGWTLYQATATDSVTVDYYTSGTSANLADHVKYLGTFLQGTPLNVDLPSGAPTVRHCYYPGTTTGGTGSLNPISGDPLTAQVLVLEYGPGVDPTPPGPTPPGPTPPGQTVTVQVSFVFPTGITPTAPSYVTMTNGTNNYSATGITASGAMINSVPYATAGTSYSYSASGVLIGTQNYCPSNGTTTVSASAHSFTVTYTACSVPPPSPGNKVIAYLLTADTIAGADGKLGTLMTQLSGSKPNFNRLVLSFLQPTFPTYTKGSLACSGILGFYCPPATQVGQEQYDMTRKAQLQAGTDSFNAVKADIATLKAQGVEVFLAVGGWDYSCDPQIYCQSLSLYNSTIDPATCNSAPYGSFCEPPDQPQKFDWFPDPTSSDPTEKNNAQLSYANVVTLTKDLGADGIDLDYEEFWHADWNRRTWNVDNNFTSYINTWGTVPQQRFDALSYSALNTNKTWISATANHTVTSGGVFAMPDTIAKIVGITETLVAASGSQSANLRFSMAAPAVGATPILTPQSGSDKTETNGSVWWGGNLKGLVYNMGLATATTDRPNGILDDFDTLSVMTYDLGPNDYPAPLNTLPNQVGYYVREYNIWLQSNPVIPKPGTTGYNDVVPKQFNYKGHIAFGFEIGQPAYPKTGWQSFTLTQDFVNTILSNLGAPSSNIGYFDADAMIMWEMNKPIAALGPVGQATPLYALKQTCLKFGLDASRYCQSSAPTPVPPTAQTNNG